MPIEIRLPELAPAMTEGTLAAWHKQVGEWVKPGDVVADIETDKSLVELEAPEEGRLGRILVPEGTENVPVGAVIALLLAEGEELEEAGAPRAAGSPQASEEPAPPAPEGSSEIPRAGAAPEIPAPEPRTEAAPAGRHAPPPPAEPPRSTPLARRIAEQAGLDLAGLEGSGVSGRIVKADVEAALGEASAPAPGSGRARERLPVPSEEEAPFHEVRHSSTRRVVAARLAEAKRTIPHFYLQVECDMEALLELRRNLNECLAGEGEKSRLSVNDFVVRAAALALRRVPQANVSWREEALRVHDRIDVSVAVATDRGLVTPVVRDADHLGLQEVSGRLRELARRARDGSLRPQEYQGGTFTVSNLGMYGVRTLYPIINPPQSAVLGAGAVEERLVARDGRAVVRRTMSCTLSCDHRAVDGSVGAELLASVRTLIEEPVRMLL